MCIINVCIDGCNFTIVLACYIVVLMLKAYFECCLFILPSNNGKGVIFSFLYI